MTHENLGPNPGSEKKRVFFSYSHIPKLFIILARKSNSGKIFPPFFFSGRVKQQASRCPPVKVKLDKKALYSVPIGPPHPQKHQKRAVADIYPTLIILGYSYERQNATYGVPGLLIKDRQGK